MVCMPDGVCDGMTTVIVCNGILIYNIYRTSYIVTTMYLCVCYSL